MDPTQMTPEALAMLQALHGANPQAGMANDQQNQQASLGNNPAMNPAMMGGMPPQMYGPMMQGPPGGMPMDPTQQMMAPQQTPAF